MTKQQKIAKAWQDFYATNEGALAVGELMMALGVYSEINAENSFQAGVAIGQRNVAARIAKYLEMKPQTYVSDVKTSLRELDALDELLQTKRGDY